MPCRVKNDFSLQFDLEVVYLSRGLNHGPVPETDVWMGQAGIYPGLPSYYLNNTTGDKSKKSHTNNVKYPSVTSVT